MAKRNLTARQVRYLWAVGAFRRKSGTKRGVVYDRAAAQRARPVIGGSKAAGLRSGAGSGRKVPSKAERDASRPERLARAYDTLGKFAGKKAAGLRRANPEKLKEMPSNREGRFKDTGKLFAAGATIHYGTRKGDESPGAYQRAGNRRIDTISFSDTSKKSTRTAQAAARAASDVKQGFTSQGLRKRDNFGGLMYRTASERADYLRYTSRRRRETYENLAAEGLKLSTPRQLLGLRFQENYRSIKRPRWKKP